MVRKSCIDHHFTQTLHFYYYFYFYFYFYLSI